MSDIEPKIPGENDPLPVVMTQEEENAMLGQLLSGEVPPANEMVEYFLDKVKSLGQEGIATEAMLKKITEQNAIAQQRIMSIRCELNAYRQDLLEWQKRK